MVIVLYILPHLNKFLKYSIQGHTKPSKSEFLGGYVLGVGGVCVVHVTF